jgi:hypothetical protein
MNRISELTSEQEALLETYKTKWYLKALSSTPIDKQKAIKAIEAVYRHISKSEGFDVYFFDSPYGVANLSFLDRLYPNENWQNPRKLNNLIKRVRTDLFRQCSMDSIFFKNITISLLKEVGQQLEIELWNEIGEKLYFGSPMSVILGGLQDSEKISPIWQSAKASQRDTLSGLWCVLAAGLSSPDTMCWTCSCLDYCINELNCSVPEELWDVLKTFVEDCGWTFLFQDFCFACDRPHTLLLDANNKIHSENAAAVQFSDGFTVFANHGEFVPRF